MKKYFLSFLFILMSLISLSELAFAGTFPDVDDFHPNVKAIDYLHSKGIVNGFTDGTFGPGKNITRCEFLKIVMEASNIVTENSSSQVFPDLARGFWCDSYANTAKKMGVVKGDEKGLFWPQKDISRIEALKLLYSLRQTQVQPFTKSPYSDVPESSWYSSYIKQSYESNVLTGISSNLFGINTPIRREEMAEMMYRLDIIELNKVSKYEYGMTIDGKPITEDSPSSISTPYINKYTGDVTNSSGTINPNFYEKILLDYVIPRSYVLGEIYRISGTTTSIEKTVTIFLTNEKDKKQYIFKGLVNNSLHFDIDVEFSVGGNFTMGILPGDSGVSNVEKISVVSEEGRVGNIFTDVATDLNKKITIDGDTLFEWDNKGADLSKIVIKQGENMIIRNISKGVNLYKPNYVDYIDFKEGDAYWTVFLGDSKDGSMQNMLENWSKNGDTKKINITKHNFLSYDKDYLTITGFTIEATKEDKIVLYGISNSDLRTDIALITPDGFVEEMPLTSNKTVKYDSSLKIGVFKAPATFSLELSFEENGVYFFELNSANGLALYNSPIYVGDYTPLLPDFKDLMAVTKSITKSQLDENLENYRLELLGMINADRVRHGLKKVEIDETLGEMAQSHSEDMSLNDYFSHVNKNGLGPSERKIDFDIMTPVGENLAKAQNLMAIHEGLMRSAIHRSNILRDDWERVGIGISMDKQGSLNVVQEFSTNPFTLEEVKEIQADLYNYLNIKRFDLTLPVFKKNLVGETVALSWSQKMFDDGFFNFTDPLTEESLQTNVKNTGFNKSFSTVILSGGSLENITANLNDSLDIFSQPRWDEISIGVASDNSGTILNTTLIFFDI